jgi:hypothetical protein
MRSLLLADGGVDNACREAAPGTPGTHPFCARTRALELEEGTVVADRVGETPCVFLAGLYRAERPSG